MTFTRTHDAAQIGAIMRHPRLYQADDYAPPRDEFEPRMDAAACQARA